MAKQKKETVPMIAELTLTSPLGVEIVQSFDLAWRRSLELPHPVNVKLNGFVRKDDYE